MQSKKQLISLFVLVLFVLGLFACTAPTPEVIEKVVTEVVMETVVIEGTPQVVEKEVTRVVEVEKEVTSTPEPVKGPAVGGTLVVAAAAEPTTLDPHLSGSGGGLLLYLGATLVAKDPYQEGAYVPYLAESWTTSDDGLVWDFKLREDVKFHNGNPLTANDYVWTIERMLNPDLKSPAAAGTLGAVASVEAVDDYTLRLTLSQPYYPLLENLELGFNQPLSQQAVEEWGEEYGRHPVGVGPYVFKEWVTGEKIILERNPDFNWAPAFLHQGAPYIQTIEVRIIPEYASRLAGMEAGEITFVDTLLNKDVQLLQDTGLIDIYEGYKGGMTPYITLNNAQAPFDDVLVRQALNYAVDKDSLIQIVVGGKGIPQYGPISVATHGYWPGVEYVGYKYDLEKAKALLQEAGYAPNADGIMEKDGQPLAITFKTYQDEIFVKVAEVLQAQFADLGVSVEIAVEEPGVLYGDLLSGQYNASIMGYDYTEFAVVPVFFHSSNIGAMNFISVNDPELDALLDVTNTATDPETRQKAADDAQRRIVEQAYAVPLYTPTQFAAVNKTVKGVIPETFGTAFNRFYLNDLYIEEE